MSDAPLMVKWEEPADRLLAYQWTPALVRAALIQAEGGNLRLSADLCETMHSQDDRIKACTDTRCDAVLGLPLIFEAGSRAPKRAVKALEAEEDWYAAIHESEQKKLHHWGFHLGVGVASLDWQERGKRVIPVMRTRNPRHLRWDWNDRAWMLRVSTGGASSQEIKITPGDGKWVLFTPYGVTRPWIFGAYSTLANWYLSKRQSLFNLGLFVERMGMGVWTVEGAEATEKDRKDIASRISTLGRGGILVMPRGLSAKLTEAQSRTWDAFLQSIEQANQASAVTILGQAMSTSSTSGGSYGAMSAAGKVSFGLTKADVEALSTTYYEQILRWWAIHNYGTPDAAPYVTRDTSALDDKKAAAAVLQMQAQAQATLVGAGIRTPNEARASFGDPPLEGGDELQKAAAPPPPPPAQDEPSQDEPVEPIEPESAPSPPSSPTDDEEDDEEDDDA